MDAEQSSVYRRAVAEIQPRQKFLLRFLQVVSLSKLSYNGFNTDYGSSEPLKTLVMLCYVMLMSTLTVGLHYRWKVKMAMVTTVHRRHMPRLRK